MFIDFKFICLTKSRTNKFNLCNNIINKESITIPNVPITVSGKCMLHCSGCTRWLWSSLSKSPMNPVYGNGLPLLNCDLLKLCQCGVALHLAINSLLKLIPHMFNWVQGQWTGRPLCDYTVQTENNLPPGCVLPSPTAWVQMRLNTASFYGKIEPFEYICVHISHHVWHNRNHVFFIADEPWHNTTVHATMSNACWRWLSFNVVNESAWSAAVVQ